MLDASVPTSGISPLLNVLVNSLSTGIGVYSARVGVPVRLPVPVLSPDTEGWLS